MMPTLNTFSATRIEKPEHGCLVKHTWTSNANQQSLTSK